MDFLRAAFCLSRRSIYSLHKSSTRDYIQRLAERELRAQSGEAEP
jgi:predicted RNA methylase